MSKTRLDTTTQAVADLIERGEKMEAKNILLGMLKQGKVAETVTILQDIPDPYANLLLKQILQRYPEFQTPPTQEAAIPVPVENKRQAPRQTSSASRLIMIANGLVVILIISVIVVVLSRSGAGNSNLSQSIVINDVEGKHLSLTIHYPAGWYAKTEVGDFGRPTVTISNYQNLDFSRAADLPPDVIDIGITILVKGLNNVAVDETPVSFERFLDAQVYEITTFAGHDAIIGHKPVNVVDIGYTIIDASDCFVMLQPISIQGNTAVADIMRSIAEGLEYNRIATASP